ncbi:T9SS type A sorting domain-containing protein [Salisaeta longa]|uniref:T9SS type A sorting domain-containing protein n=1 Tax=Salisaeta longa TaxID=503170 RepID=UPI0003B3A56D|nr:T9SS type A sorting domain-containing protein [Salisaeta longa]
MSHASNSPTPWATVLAAFLLLLPAVAAAQINPGEPALPAVPAPERVLWLRADQDVTGTSAVSLWEDQSGNNNDATPRNLNGPAFVSSVTGLNGQPALQFDRANDEGLGPDDTPDINSDDAGYAQRTIALTFRTGGDTGTRQIIYEEGGQTNGFNVYLENGDVVASAWSQSTGWSDHYSLSAPVSANTSYVLTFVFDKDASDQLQLYLNGGAEGAFSDPSITDMSVHGGNIAIGNVSEDTQFDGATPIEVPGTGGEGFTGYVAEVVLSNVAFNDAQRQIVESDLAERYGITITNDRYALSGFLGDITGVGEAQSGDRQTRAQSGIVSLESTGFGTAPSFGLIGHNRQPNSFTEDTDPSGIGTRLERVWRYDAKNTASFNLSFDVSALPTLASGQSYRLLVETDPTFTSGATVVSGTLNNGTFTVSASDLNSAGFSDGDHFTLAKTDVAGPASLAYSPNPLADLQGNLPLSASATVTGANGTVTYRLADVSSSDGVPTVSFDDNPNGDADVEIDTQTGEITVNAGAPVGTYTATVEATDSDGTVTFPDVLTITVQEPVTIAYDTPSQVVIYENGSAESIQPAMPNALSIEDGTVTYSIVDGNDPTTNGLTFDSSTGKISGTPTSPGLLRFVVEAAGSGAAAGTPTAEVNIAVVGGDGPAGVGDDASTLAIFDASSLSAVDSNPVNTWPDLDASPNSNDVSADGAAPIYRASVTGLNGHPALDFSETTGLLRMPDNPQFNNGGQPYVQRTLALAFQTGSSVSSGPPEGIYAEGGGTRGISVYVRGGDLYVGLWNLNPDDGSTPWGPHFFRAETQGSGSGTVTIDPNTAYVVTLTYNYAANVIEAYVNGTLIGTATGPADVGRLFDHDDVTIGGGDNLESDSGDANYSEFTGQIAEVIAYGVALSDAQRRLVESSLGAKYGIAVANPVYDLKQTDEFLTGTDVVGIGRTSGANAHDPDVASEPLQITGADISSGTPFFTIGHDNGSGTTFTADKSLPSTSDGEDVSSRLARTWRVDLNGGSPTFDITFNVTDFSLGNGQEYVLLVDSKSDFRSNSDALRPTSADTTSSGDGTVTWASSDLGALDDADYVTIGKTLGNPSPPSNLTYSPNPLRVSANAITAAQATPSYDGGQPAPTFQITNGAAAGISIDSNSGVLTVDPQTAAQDIYTLTIEASNKQGNDGGATTTTVDVEVYEPLTDLSYADAVQTVTTGDAMQTVLPAFTPALSTITSETITYSLQRVYVNNNTQTDLSGTGLTFNTTSGEISGTPSQLGTVSIVVQAVGSGGAGGTVTAPVKITAVGDQGIAGIGDATTTLLNLTADAAQFTGSGTVDLWPDASTYGNDATPSTSGAQPTYLASGLNGRPALQFDGTDDVDVLGIADAASLNSGDGPYVHRALTVVFETSNDVSSRQVLYEQGGGTRGLNIYISNNTLYVGGWNEQDDTFSGGGEDPTTPWEGGTDDQFVAASTPINTNTAYTATLVFDYAKGTMELLLNGAVAATATGVDAGVGRLYDHGGDIGIGAVRNQTKFEDGSEPENGNHFTGKIAALVFYEASLNSAHRTLLHNALAARYGIALDTGNGAQDVYAGDTNGDYDLGVFGIGRDGAASAHTKARRGGFRLAAAGGLDAGDYLTAGHKTPTNASTTSDIGGVTGLQARMTRIWRFTAIDPAADLSANVIMDLSEAGFSTVAGTAGDYVLLTRACGSTNWAQAATGSSIANGDEISFGAVSFADGQCYTVGTTDQVNSPISSTALTIVGTSGSNGGDAGWRDMGMPVLGGTVADVLQGNGNPLYNATSIFYAWDDDANVSSSPQRWTRVGSNDQLPNGRGFTVYFRDKGATAIDPTFTVQAASGLIPPGDTDVIVGDEQNPNDTQNLADDPLNVEAQWHFLANPYGVPYDLTHMTGVSDFQANVQVWDVSSSGYEVINLVPTNRTGITAWQAFFLERTEPGLQGGPETVTFDASGRQPAASNTNAFFGNSQKQAPQRPPRLISLEVIGRDSSGVEVARDEAANLLFYERASAAWGRYDATKLTPPVARYIAIAPMGEGRTGEPIPKAQEARPVPQSPVSIPLAFTSRRVQGRITLRAARWENIPEGWSVELVDTKGTPDTTDDVVHSLGPKAEGYTFSTTSSKAKEALQKRERTQRSMNLRPQALQASMQKTGAVPNTRFVIRIDPGSSPLPVELATFDVSKDEEQAYVHWRTASETNNAGFYVEHQVLSPSDSTTRAAAWKALGFVEGHNTTNEPQSYQFRTERLSYGLHAFRLRQVDHDGSVSYSKEVMLSNRLRAPVAVRGPYPNPSRVQPTLEVTVRSTQRIAVHVYDLLGRRVKTVFNDVLSGQQTRKLSVDVGDLASGTYFLRVRGTSFARTERLTVIR